MQIFTHKNTTLTTCQRFLIERSIELLHLSSVDSYRVRLFNPKSIFEELKYCLHEFDAGRIKHFQTIKGKEQSPAIVEEALSLLEQAPNYLTFNSLSKKYVELSLKGLNEHNYKSLITSIDIILEENKDYIQNIINGLRNLITSNNDAFEELYKIDRTLGILFCELINVGFSKGFLYKIVYGHFVYGLTDKHSFDVQFDSFLSRVTNSEAEHEVIFRIDTTRKVYDSISAIVHNNFTLSDNINDISLSDRRRTELESFNTPASSRKFIRCKVRATDYLAALKRARNLLSEYLDVINLGLSDEFLDIHNRALVIDTRSKGNGGFQLNINILDGKYKVAKDHYIKFTNKLPSIFENSKIADESKAKIKSAIRYLRLGNQSTEVEHKFINYWIGLEFMFSNYESQSTINRLKMHFINAHGLAYVKRNIYDLRTTFETLKSSDKMKVKSYIETDEMCWREENLYNEISMNLKNSHPLLAFRAWFFKETFFKPGKAPSASEYLKKHKQNLEIHFTRIYRLRNEIIHDAATDTNNEQIASNLRYYLTFILNEVIDFLYNVISKDVAVEDYYILNEIKIGNISTNGYALTDLLDVDSSIDFLE